MKQIAVVVNNQLEWKHFVDVSQWNFSKQNKRYKCTRECFVDIAEQKAYFYVNVNRLQERLDGESLHSYIHMCTITPEQEQFLNSYVRGE
jgi:hypothetical protein